MTCFFQIKQTPGGSGSSKGSGVPTAEPQNTGAAGLNSAADKKLKPVLVKIEKPLPHSGSHSGLATMLGTGTIPESVTNSYFLNNSSGGF